MPGLNGTSALAFTNTENVGVAPAAVVICAEAASGCRHTPRHRIRMGRPAT